MSRPVKILAIAAGSIAGLILLLIIAALVTVQTSWFANFAKNKIIAAVEDATGGVVQIGSLDVNLAHLTIRLRNVVLHGTEPQSQDPLLRIAVLELRLKLFSGIAHVLDLNYLGVEQPRVNLIVLPNGNTNIPQPKVQQTSNSNPLQTVVDLKVDTFDLENGLIKALDQQTGFSAQGQNLRAQLTYSTANPGYTGNLSMNPLLLVSGRNPALPVNVSIPVAITAHSISVANAKLIAPQSQIGMSVSLTNPDSPVIAGTMDANISLAEMQRCFELPLHPNAQGVPAALTANVAFNYNDGTKALQVRNANITLGQTTLSAAGETGPHVDGAVRFRADVALEQLSRLLALQSVQLAGDLHANGNATLDAHNNLAINGVVDSTRLAVRSGSTHLSGVTLNTPFHADPYLISLDGLRLNVLGGGLAAKIFIENMQQLSVESNLKHFSLQALASAFAGKPLAYDGVIDGSAKARGDLKAKGVTGYTAQAQLSIVPGSRGVPVGGRINASYAGANGAVDLGQSYIALPNSRLDLSGTLNTRLNLKLVSHNLNDFLPAVNFEATHPETALPVTLRGGTAAVNAQVTGSLPDPRINGQIAVDHFAVENHTFHNLSMNIAASASAVSVQTGVLSGPTLETHFTGALGLVKWTPVPRSPVSADLTMHSSNIGDLLALAGQPAKEASGQLAAEAHIHGVYGDPLGSATLQVVNGTIENQPFSRLYGNVNLADRLITLSSLELDTAGGIVSAKGTFQHAPDNFLVGHAQAHLAVNNVQLAQVKPLQQQQPVAGLIQMTADTAADVVQQNHQSALRIANVSADVSASGLQIQHQDAGSLTASARTANGTVTYQLTSDFAGSNVHINGHTGLNPDYPTVADASIQDLSISKVLQITGETSIPASGSLSADAHMSGTLHAPDANLRLNLSHGNIYQEPINHLRGSLSYSNTVLSISALELSAPAGNISLSGTFTHPADDFKSGSLTLKVNSSPVEVSKIEHVASAEPGLKGTLQLAADASARVLQTNGSPALRFSNLNAKAAFQNVTYNATPLGGANLNAQTKGQTLTFQMDSDLAKSQIRGSGQAQLIGSYPVRASVTFANVRYSNLEPLVGAGAGLPTPADALVEGEASIDGPVLAPDNLTGRLQINRFEVMTNPQPSPTGGPPTRKVDFENKGPIILALDHSVIQVQALHITGPAANLSASGSFNLKNASSPLGLTVGASLDLAALQDVNHDFYSSGRIALNSTVHGNLSQPLANGRIELTNANINYINSPNGLSNGNGVILLNGASATIQSLTGQTGGGTVSVAGFVGFSGRALNFNLKATAQKVRVLYSGIGVVSNANLTLLGSTRRSLLNGTVTVTRLSYTSSSDAGSLLSAASAPPATPTAPSPLLTGMHLNVHILTSLDLRVVSTYTDSLEVAANLTVRGTAESPGVLGRLTVTNGQLVFFGNTYNVQTGAINFYDPNSIDPILNISLQTVAQGVSVTIGVSGAMDDLKLTYRSDPPLTFEQIVQLLATNTTPANPVIAAQQPPAQQQSLSQMGESALLGQAVANPLASRVQRVFGLTQLKIDPSFSGTNGQPDAQISLQQKIASNITFTYITDVTQTNGQIIRVQWDLTDKLSAVGLRDYNGNVSVELFYKFTKR